MRRIVRMSRAHRRLRGGYNQVLSCPVPILRQLSRILRKLAGHQPPWGPRVMSHPQRQAKFLEPAEFAKFAPRRSGAVRCPCTTRAVAHSGPSGQVRFRRGVGVCGRSLEAHGLPRQDKLARSELRHGDDGAPVARERITPLRRRP